MDDNTWIEEVFKLYESYNTKVYQYLQRLSEIELKRKQNIGVKMERVKMPFFDSNIRNYAKFKKDFERQIQKQVDSEETLIYVLKSCLSEKALNAVKNIDDDIKEIWKRLDDKFGKPSVLIDIVMNDIKEIKSVKDGDMKEFIHFVEIIEKGYADLSRLSLQREMSNSVTTSMIEERLPALIKREWSKEVNKSDSKVDPFDKFPEFMKFLLEQKRILEYEITSLRNIPDKSALLHHGMQELSQNPGSTVPTKGSCIIHNSNKHTTEECRTYTCTDPAERLDLLKELRACFSCLKIGHRITDCINKKACGINECNMHHHITLHIHPQNLVSTYHAMSLGGTDGSNKISVCLLPMMLK